MTEIAKTTRTTKTTQTATNKELSAGLAEIKGTTEMTETTGIRFRGTGAIPPPYRAIGYSYTLSLFVFQV